MVELGHAGHHVPPRPPGGVGLGPPGTGQVGTAVQLCGVGGAWATFGAIMYIGCD